MSKWDKERAILEDLILNQKVSYEEIGRQYGCTGANIKKVAKLQGIELPQRRVVNKKETFNKITEEKLCLSCGKVIPNRNKYCDNICQGDFEYTTYIQEWKDGFQTGSKGVKTLGISNHLRRYMFEKYDNKCQRCGWNKLNEYTGLIPLTVHHIDGVNNNNKEENLELLCPNCHSLTENYGSRNIKCVKTNRHDK